MSPSNGRDDGGGPADWSGGAGDAPPREEPLLKAIAVAHEQLEMRIAASLEEQRRSILQSIGGLEQAGRPREEALMAVGDRLEALTRLVRGQAAVQLAHDGGELEAAEEELHAALFGSGAAPGGRRPPRAPARPFGGLEEEKAARQGATMTASVLPAATRTSGGREGLRSDDPPTPCDSKDPPEGGQTPPPGGRADAASKESCWSIPRFFGEGRSSKNVNMAHSNPVLRAVERAVKSHGMEIVSSLLITLNTMFMVLEGQLKGARIGNEIGVYSYYGSDRFFQDESVLTVDDFVTIDVVFCVLFTVELLLRLAFLRLDFLRDPWGWFDIVVVLTTNITTFLFLWGASNGEATTFSSLRALRLVRLLRIMRLARSITAFDSLYVLTTALRGSMSTLMWVVVFLLLAQTLFALVLSNVVQDFYLAPPGDGDEFFQTSLEKEEAYKYFGTFWRAMVSLFELMLANWPTICRVMMETMHESWSVFALAYKLIMGVAVIGVIMGVFTQETFRAADTDDQIMIRRKAIQVNHHNAKMRDFFQHIASASGNGDDSLVDVNLFERALKSPAMKLWLQAMDVDVSDASLLFYLIDKDGDGTLTPDELVAGMASLKGGARNIDVKMLLRQSRVVTMQRQSGPELRRLSTADALRLFETGRASSREDSEDGTCSR